MSQSSTKISFLPERIRDLERLSFNLLWGLGRRARRFFRNEFDPALWASKRYNPVEMLRAMDPDRLAALAADPDFLAEHDAVMTEFDDTLRSEKTWFKTTFPKLGDAPVAYFCAEFGLHSSIPIYSGGLGVLAGDHCKAASDLGIPFVGVGLLYSKGYFDQHLNLEGWQESSEEDFDPRGLPLAQLTRDDGSTSLVVLRTGERDVHVGAWRLDVGRVKLILLDTNLPENEPEDRELTHQLYGGGRLHRLKQEWILGVGGVRVLRALGIEPGAWHANEGHAAFMMVERLRERIAEGADLVDAAREVRARSVFTTHTPVAAGHDSFSPELIREVTGDYHRTLGLTPEEFLEIGSHPESNHEWFHMTAAALRLASHVNGVSREHQRVTRELWSALWPEREPESVPIGGVTNGVHLATWMALRMMELLDGQVGADWEDRVDDPEMWDRVPGMDDAEVWQAHRELKSDLLEFCRERARSRWSTIWEAASQVVGAGTLLGPEPLTIGFARRFATYKRADLLFRDEGRLERLLTDSERPVQIIFSGKAHPADDEGKRLLQRVWKASHDPRFQGRIAFLEDYELYTAHRLVQGVDLWLNLPRAPLEASGTSGMKAAFNGVPQLSVLDGWWAEGYNQDNGWAIHPTGGTDAEIDEHDHETLFGLLENEVVPAFYERDARGIPVRWVSFMKESVRVAGKHFTMRRMVQEYCTEFYGPALSGSPEGDDPPTDRSWPEVARSLVRDLPFE